MIIDTEQRAKSYIKAPNPGVHLFVGESYLVKVYSEMLEKNVCDITSPFDFFEYEADEFDFSSFCESCVSYPVLSENVCVVLKKLDILKMKKNDLDELIDFLPKIAEKTYVVITEKETDVAVRDPYRKIVLDRFSGVGCVFDFSARTENSLSSLLVSSAKKRNKKISGEAAAYLVNFVGTDLNNLLNEFDKVCSYSDGDEVTIKDINEICVKSSNARIFDIVNYIFAKKSEKAWNEMGILLSQKEDSFKILSVLSMCIVDIYRGMVSVKKNGNTKDTAKAYEYKSRAFALDNAVKNASGASLETVKKCLDECARADERMKSTGINKDLQLERLVINLSEIVGEKVK